MTKAIEFHGTTVVAVRRAGRVVLAGDGQVTMGSTVMKRNARKIPRLRGGSVRPARSIRPGTFDASTTSAEAGRPSPSITEPPFSNQVTVAETSASTK